MTKEEARILFMDLMYGELSKDKASELQFFIEQHADLKQEFEELSGAKSILQHLPVQSPSEQLVIMESNREPSKHWFSALFDSLIPVSTFAKTGFALASFVLLVFVLGSFTKMAVRTGENGFSITFGEQALVQTGYTAAQVELIINQVQQENAILVNEIVWAAQEQQELQFQQAFASFADYLNEQRNTDLQLINYGLINLEETTYNRFRQTDQVLGEIIQTVSTNK